MRVPLREREKHFEKSTVKGMKDTRIENEKRKTEMGEDETRTG